MIHPLLLELGRWDVEPCGCCEYEAMADAQASRAQGFTPLKSCAASLHPKVSTEPLS